MNPRRLSLVSLGSLLLVFGGKTFAATEPLTAEQGTGLAFGAFDITESDLAVTHAVLMRVKPTKVYMGSSGERATVTYQNGEFYSANLTPGVYAVMGFFSGQKFFPLERSLRTNTFQVEPGRVAYAGIYKLKLTKGSLFRSDKGSFTRIDTQEGEAKLLDWLAKELAASGWATSVNARRAEIKK